MQFFAKYQQTEKLNQNKNKNKNQIETGQKEPRKNRADLQNKRPDFVMSILRIDVSTESLQILK